MVTIGLSSLGLVVGGVSTWALAARPATKMVYPESASATRFAGLAFDACDAPPRSVMQAWRASPYGAAGIYISGNNRACRQRELTASWVRDVSAMGWKFLPLDVGLQAPCADRTRRPMSRDLATAEKQGTSAAKGALQNAANLGILPGSAIYSDIESFSATDAGCADAVRSYLSGWTTTLHRGGYLAGVYGNLQSAMRRLSASHADARFARPDAVWSAQWDRRATLTNWAGVPAEQWPAGQRIKQYIGDHYESYGGYRVNIDSNAIDAPVATVAQPFRLTGAAPVSLRDGPSPLQLVERTLQPGATVNVVCQIGTPSGRWDKLHDGSFVPDAVVAGGAAKAAVPPCAVPFQVRTTLAQQRTGPGTEYLQRSLLPAGALAWIQCETPGITLGKPGYWASVAGGGWVSGALLARPQRYGRSLAVPLCELGSAAQNPASPPPGALLIPVPPLTIPPITVSPLIPVSDL